MKTRTAYLGSRLLWFFTFIALLTFTITCDSDDDDIKDQTFLEKNDGTKWKYFDDDFDIYMRINDDMTKPIEIWESSFDFDKGIDDAKCYYYYDDLLLDLENGEMEILENSSNKLEFTYLGEDFWIMSIEGNRLKMSYYTLGEDMEYIYFDKTNENLDDMEICSDDMKNIKFKFLKRKPA